MLSGADRKCYESSDKREISVDWVSEEYQRRLHGGGEATAAWMDRRKDGGI